MTRRQTRRYFCLALFPALLFAQDAPDLQDTPAAKDTHTSPKLLYKVEPEYTNQARSAGLSGKALLSLVVDVDGRPKDIKVASPLAAGLAEQAVKAVSKWRFQPGTSNGVAVPMTAHVEVNFRICRSCTREPDPTYERLEAARGMYNMGIHQLRGDLEKKDLKAAFDSMQRAANMDYPPAEVVLGLFYLGGTGTTVTRLKPLSCLTALPCKETRRVSMSLVGFMRWERALKRTGPRHCAYI